MEGVKPPPPQPWVKGVQPEYRCFQATIEICQDNEQNVYSSHHLTDDNDALVCDSLPSKGLEQLAFGLITESLRREALIEMLVRMSSDDAYIEKYVGMSDEDKQKTKMEFAVEMNKMMEKIMFNLVPSVTEEVFHMMVESTKEPNNTEG